MMYEFCIFDATYLTKFRFLKSTPCLTDRYTHSERISYLLHCLYPPKTLLVLKYNEFDLANTFFYPFDIVNMFPRKTLFNKEDLFTWVKTFSLGHCGFDNVVSGHRNDHCHLQNPKQLLLAKLHSFLELDVLANCLRIVPTLIQSSDPLGQPRPNLIAHLFCLTDSVINGIYLHDELPVNGVVRVIELSLTQSEAPSLVYRISDYLFTKVPPDQSCAAQFCQIILRMPPGICESFLMMIVATILGVVLTAYVTNKIKLFENFIISCAYNMRIFEFSCPK